MPDSVSLSAADEEGTRLVTAKIAKRGLAKAWQSVAILAAPEQAVGVRVAYIKNVVGKASLVNKSSLVTAAISVIAI